LNPCYYFPVVSRPRSKRPTKTYRSKPSPSDIPLRPPGCPDSTLLGSLRPSINVSSTAPIDTQANLSTLTRGRQLFPRQHPLDAQANLSTLTRGRQLFPRQHPSDAQANLLTLMGSPIIANSTNLNAQKAANYFSDSTPRNSQLVRLEHPKGRQLIHRQHPQ